MVKRKALLLVVLLLATLPALLIAEDRQELGTTLKMIPPNGPFWKFGTVTMRQHTRKAGVKPVVFPHWAHRAQFTCRVCHVELGFSMQARESGITRALYLDGKFCGACHDGKTAFTVKESKSPQCVRCHMEDTKGLEARFNKFAEALPMSSFGNGIDWAKALGDGLISPRDSLASTRQNMKFPEKLRAPIRLGTTSPRSDVTFSHEEHFAELDCSSCHPDIFTIKRKGTEKFTMLANVYGSFCGACHMRVAFPMNDCRRCHPKMTKFSGA